MSNIAYNLEKTSRLSQETREQCHKLFAANYREANHRYLDKSLAQLGNIALAWADGALVGFSLADVLLAPIPGLAGKQHVALGGMGCIDAGLRREGLFSRLAQMAGTADNCLEGAGNILACGRMAHPASFRTLSRSPHALPKHGRALTSWHLEVAQCVADFYDVTLKPGTLVVAGDGRPVGYSNIEMQVEASELAYFKDVDRSRGESLLGIAWLPDAPEGW